MLAVDITVKSRYQEMEEIISIFRQTANVLSPQSTTVAPLLGRLTDIRAVLFDVYGTLFISGSGDIGVSAELSAGEMFAQALIRSGCTIENEDAGDSARALYLEAIKHSHKTSQQQGIEVPEVDIRNIWFSVLALLKEKGKIAAEVEKHQAKKTAAWYEALSNPTYPMPGALAAIQNLKDQGLSLGIVSNAQFYTPLLFNSFFDQAPESLGFEPDYCAWSYKTGSAKPSTLLFESPLRELAQNDHIQPHQVVYVGNDMLNDVYTATRMGCKTILFAGDARSLRLRENRKECEGLFPTAVITSLLQIGGIIR